MILKVSTKTLITTIINGTRHNEKPDWDSNDIAKTSINTDISGTNINEKKKKKDCC